MEAHEGLAPCLVLTSANDYASLIEGEFARPAGVRVLYAGSRETDDVRSEDMIYSASSVTSLTSSSLGNDPAYYVKRQLKGIAIGVVLAVALARLDYRVLTKHLLRYVWLATVILLLLIFTPFAGSDAYGASRWISIAGFTLQPSEFAKITIILTAANLAARYFEDRSIDFNHFVGLLVLGVGLPLGLILLQPDKGSTIIACVTLLIMDPSFLIGGVVEGYDTNGRNGEGGYFVCEADESDGSFLYLNPTIAVVTNIEADHLDHYGTLENIEKTFCKFMSSSSVAWYLGEGNVWMEPAKIATTANQSVEDAALAQATSEGELLITGVPATVQPVVGAGANDAVLDAVATYRSSFSSDFASQIVSFSAASVESISCVLSSGVEVSLGSPTNISSKETVVTGLLDKYPGELTYINVRVPSNPSYRRITSDTVQAGSGATGSATGTSE